MTARGLGDDDVLVTQTGCLFPCNHAPVVVVHPDDSWFGPVRADDAPALVGHLVEAREFGPLLDRSPRDGEPGPPSGFCSVGDQLLA